MNLWVDFISACAHVENVLGTLLFAMQCVAFPEGHAPNHPKSALGDLGKDDKESFKKLASSTAITYFFSNLSCEILPIITDTTTWSR